MDVAGAVGVSGGGAEVGLGAVSVAGAEVGFGGDVSVSVAASGVLVAGSAVSVGAGDVLVGGAAVSVTCSAVRGLADGVGAGTHATSATASRRGNSLRNFIDPPAV